MRPASPMIRNIARQPRVSESTVRTGGAIAEPHFDPESQMPAAWPRSSRGNQEVVILLQFGELGDSPMPSRNRKVRKCVIVWPTDISAVAIDQMPTAAKYILRAPSLSMR